MKNPSELIGIAVAAYQPNSQHFAEQLESIRNQSFSKWKCAISFDSPVSEIKNNPKFEVFFSDPRFVWIQNERQLGHKRNFEKAIQEVLRLGVDAIACSDQDDVWFAEKLEICRSALSQLGSLSMVHSDMFILRNDQIERNHASVWNLEKRGVDFAEPRHLLVRNVVAGCSMLFDAELARKFPTIPDEAEFHDHWYALAAAFCGTIQPIRKELFAYRQHGSNVVGVTPFQGIFHFNQRIMPPQILAKCRAGWLKSNCLAIAAERSGLVLNVCDRKTFLGRDLGWGLLEMARHYRVKDAPLARASLARGFGKFSQG